MHIDVGGGSGLFLRDLGIAPAIRFSKFEETAGKWSRISSLLKKFGWMYLIGREGRLQQH